jgi:ribonuclease HI
MNVDFEWVKAHNENVYNEQVDALAKKAAEISKQNAQ